MPEVEKRLRGGVKKRRHKLLEVSNPDQGQRPAHDKGTSGAAPARHRHVPANAAAADCGTRNAARG